MNQRTPPRVSPYGLIQETLWPDEWKMLVVCMLLNCTTRRAVEKVVPHLFRRYPDAASMAVADLVQLSQLIAPLGFRNRRSAGLVKMSTAYLRDDWTHARELPGIGDYGAASWEIFSLGVLPVECPTDHALTKYWKWRKAHGE